MDGVEIGPERSDESIGRPGRGVGGLAQALVKGMGQDSGLRTGVAPGHQTLHEIGGVQKT